MSTPAKPTTTGRTAEFTFEINAPVADVWAAITEAEHLMNWFPLTAEVKPGQGGTMFMAWGDAFNGSCTIEVWEPNSRLRTTFMDAPDGPMRTRVEYHLEGGDGPTTLRLVHSGFGEGADWDRLYDGVSRGWSAELRSLRHYVENHFGEPRAVAWASVPFEKDQARMWALLMGERCLGIDSPGSLGPGDRFSADGPTLGKISGTALLAGEPGILLATVDELNNAYLRVELERCSGTEPTIWFWLSTYGASAETMSTLDARINETLGELIG